MPVVARFGGFFQLFLIYLDAKAKAFGHVDKAILVHKGRLVRTARPSTMGSQPTTPSSVSTFKNSQRGMAGYNWNPVIFIYFSSHRETIKAHVKLAVPKAKLFFCRAH
jgi:hypothetical protein